MNDAGDDAEAGQLGQGPPEQGGPGGVAEHDHRHLGDRGQG